jgi:hypothetical protein
MPVSRGNLPSRYSALQPNGNGIQSIYLTEVPLTFAEVLAGLIGQAAQHLTSAVEVAGAGSFQGLSRAHDPARRVFFGLCSILQRVLKGSG